MLLRLAGLVACLFAAACLNGDETTVLRRVQSHLLIRDLESAKGEAAAGLSHYPASRLLLEKQIEVLAEVGDEQAMMHFWDRYARQYPEPFAQSNLLEAMSWGVIKKGFATASPLTRAIALVAANLSQSAQGVDLLVQGTKDPNAAVRAVALELSVMNRDARLQERALDLLQNETSWPAKAAAMKAVGGMKVQKAKPVLRQILESRLSTDEERGIAAEALAMISEKPTRETLERMAGSSRMGLRLLACELAALFDLADDIDVIAPLLHDFSPQIRKAALQVAGVLRISDVKGTSIRTLVAPMTQDADPSVAAIAGWVLMLDEDPRGQETLRRCLQDDKQEVRSFAAACLKGGGRYAHPLLEETFHQARDPYVRMTCAIGLIGQRLNVQSACAALYEELSANNARWMWLEEGVFKGLAPSKHRHRPDIPQFPEVANQLVRLELLQLLAFLDYPQTQGALKRFLKEKTVGITGVVVALLLSEGEEEALDLIRPLAKDPDPEVRAQAALILAVWGREETVIQELEEIYLSSRRSVKEKVLEGMGRVGSHHSLPFLVDRLNEPHQHLRMIAAAGIIQCLNH